jgi:hypothetical protein
MAYEGGDFSLNILTAGYRTLGQDVNKVKQNSLDTLQEGVLDSLTPELESDMSNSELIELTAKWTSDYIDYATKIDKKQQENERYWIGKHYSDVVFKGNERPVADNIIFEATENFLPTVTAQNPEPMVVIDNTPEGRQLATNLKDFLVYQAKEQTLKLTIRDAVRHWDLYLIGVVKVVWDPELNDINTLVIRPQRMIFDKYSTIDGKGKYHGRYLGERKETTAGELVDMFPKFTEFITESVNSEMGTPVVYTEWWATVKDGTRLLFYTYRGKVLKKLKNPHFNYTTTEKRIDPETNVEYTVQNQGFNHFAQPEPPYRFLSVYKLGKQPHDETGLIQQNLSNQDMINKRLRQIDQNADNMNNGIVLSGDHFTTAQAATAAKAMRKGHPLWVPKGDVNKAYKEREAPALSGDIFENLTDMRNELRGIYGTLGTSAPGVQEDKTVRGKIIEGGLDTSRNGGIVDYIERFTEGILNMIVQFMYVYYDEKHLATVIGANKAAQTIELERTALWGRKITITIKDGSLIQHDANSEANQAMALWEAEAIDPITLFEKLDFPDPYTTAKQLFLWKSNPAALFPDLQPQVQPQPAPSGSPQPEPSPPAGGGGTPSSIISSVPIPKI